MFPSPKSQCFRLKRRLFCENQHHFACRLPIEIFYFEDFRWRFFGKITGQNCYFESAFVGSNLTSSKY